METQGLTHLHLAVSDLARSLKFYSEVFGMQVSFWAGPKMVFLNTPGSHDLLTLRQAAAGEDAGPGGGVGHFGFRLKDKAALEDAIKEVIAAGGRLIERGEHTPGHPFAYLADPDGYVIEV